MLAAHDETALLRSNQAFHDAITRLAHNDLLSSMLDPLEGRLHWLLRQNDDPLSLHREHAALYEAIAFGDADAAARASLEHVRTSRELCLGLLYPETQP